MNKIYRVIRNHHSGQTQAVSELAKSCSGRNKLVKIAITSLIAITSSTVLAGGNGGSGGGQDVTSITGSDGAKTVGKPGVIGEAGGNGGESGGNTGGKFGSGGISGTEYINNIWKGMNGGDSQSEANNQLTGTQHRAGAGGGGTGMFALEDITNNIGFSIIGGNGGNHLTTLLDNGNSLGANRGGGGGAGAGVVTNKNITNSGLIKGGNGGMGSAGGGGGSGIYVTNNSGIVNIINNADGKIIGGNGGQGNSIINDSGLTGTLKASPATSTRIGAGGTGEGGAAGGSRIDGTDGKFVKGTPTSGSGAAAIVGSNLKITNAGQIRGGNAGYLVTDLGFAFYPLLPDVPPTILHQPADNFNIRGVDGDAILFTSGSNQLILQDGSEIVGAIRTELGKTKTIFETDSTVTAFVGTDILSEPINPDNSNRERLQITYNFGNGILNFSGNGSNDIVFNDGTDIIGNFKISSAGPNTLRFYENETRYGDPSTAKINGNFEINENTTMTFRLDDRNPSNSDKLIVTGSAVFKGAKLDLQPIYEIVNGASLFAEGAPVSFSIIEAGSIAADQLFSIGTDGFWFFNLAQKVEDNKLVVTLEKKAVVDPDPEPEPEPEPEPGPEPEVPEIQFASNSNASRVFRSISVALNELNEDGTSWLFTDSLSNALRLATNTQLPTAVSLMAGEIHPTVTTAMKNKALTSLDYEFEKTRYNLMSDTPEDEWPLWIDFHTAKQDLSGDLVASADIRTSGVTFGGDIHMGTFRLGASVGYDNGNLEMHGQPAHADTRTMNLAMYGGTVYDLGNAKVNWMNGFNYQQNTIDTNRFVTFSTFNEELSAKYDVDSVSLATEVGYQYPLSKQSHVEPFFNLAYHKYSIGDIAESELSSGLKSRREGQDVVSSKVGTRVSNNFQVGTATGNINATLAWRHNMGDIESYSDMELIGNGATFQTSGIEMDENAMIVGAGTVVDVGDSLKLGLNYNGEFGSSRNENAAKVDLRWTF